MIFISYRRHDAERTTGRLYGHLEHHFRPDDLWIDSDQQSRTPDLKPRLYADVRRRDVLLVVIGPHWAEQRSIRGRRALDAEDDPIRIVLEAALRHRKTIVTVLVDGSVMPAAQLLPATIRPIATNRPIRLHNWRFKSDMRDLIQLLREAIEDAETERQPTEFVRPAELLKAHQESNHAVHVQTFPSSNPASAPNGKPAEIDRKEREKLKKSLYQPVAASRALLVVGHDTVVDVVRRRHGSDLMDNDPEPSSPEDAARNKKRRRDDK